jgi:Uma2 family endonuclease
MAIRQPRPRPPIPINEDDWSAFNGVEMSEAEFLDLDDNHETNLEYLDGATWAKALGDANHGYSTNKVLFAFGLLEQALGGESGPERRLRLPSGQYAVPDAAYWLPGIPAGNDSLPTVAVEVRSKGQSMESQRHKCRLYRDAGVPIAWLVDPLTRTVEIFEGELDAEPLPRDGVLHSDLLPGFELPVSELWRLVD